MILQKKSKEECSGVTNRQDLHEAVLWGWGWSYVVLAQVRVGPLNAVIQDADHHVPAGEPSLPGGQNVHLRATASASILTVLREPHRSGF